MNQELVDQILAEIDKVMDKFDHATSALEESVKLTIRSIKASNTLIEKILNDGDMDEVIAIAEALRAEFKPTLEELEESLKETKKCQ